MLNLETAKALQDAGLKWEPQLGDLFVADYNNGLGPTKPHVVKVAEFGEPGPEHIWIPRLDQLLAEIEKRGYGWEINRNTQGDGYDFVLLALDYGDDDDYTVKQHNCDTPEEAAAKALIWILKEAK